MQGWRAGGRKEDSSKCAHCSEDRSYRRSCEPAKYVLSHIQQHATFFTSSRAEHFRTPQPRIQFLNQVLNLPRSYDPISKVGASSTLTTGSPKTPKTKSRFVTRATRHAPANRTTHRLVPRTGSLAWDDSGPSNVVVGGLPSRAMSRDGLLRDWRASVNGVRSTVRLGDCAGCSAKYYGSRGSSTWCCSRQVWSSGIGERHLSRATAVIV